MTQAALAAAEKRVGECIRWVCEAQVRYVYRLAALNCCTLSFAWPRPHDLLCTCANIVYF